MDMYERIDKELKDAMRGKDTVKLSVLRMLMAAVKNTEILKKVNKLNSLLVMDPKDLKLKKSKL